MDQALRGVDMTIMLGTMLHSIAVGNLLPSYVKTICVDINPSTVTKLMDRGSARLSDWSQISAYSCPGWRRRLKA